MGLSKRSKGLSEGSEGLPEGPEGLPEGRAGLPEGPEGLPGGPGGPGGMEVRMDVQTDIWNVSPFYRTWSPVGAAALLPSET